MDADQNVSALGVRILPERTTCCQSIETTFSSSFEQRGQCQESNVVPVMQYVWINRVLLIGHVVVLEILEHGRAQPHGTRSIR